MSHKKIIVTLCCYLPCTMQAKPTEQIASIFVHGLGGDYSQACWYAEHNTVLYQNQSAKLQDNFSWHILQAPVYTFDFPHVHNKPWKNYVSLGQELEIASLKKTCDAIHGPKILMGLSMGASTILNYTSLHYTPDIKALVVESPFDTLESIVRSKAGIFSRFGTWLIETKVYPHYKPEGINPSRAINNLPKDLPILFIHSKADQLIPASCSWRLYKTLRSRGHKHVYLLELSSGKHANYMAGNDAQRYQETAHAFYEKYNLPCDHELASVGKKHLLCCQPCV